ncbi:MAG: hypothetical protein GDA67_15955 [Nitrospira sp. CR1.3]|nr:hypothetical protein [Nitrospira sp. CR1.3]
MNCHSVRESLGAYLDGELPVDACAPFEAHLAGCLACTSELEIMRSVTESIAKSAAVQVPARLWTEIDRRLDRPVQRELTPRNRFLRVRRYALAASVLIAVGLGAWAFLPLGGGASVARASTVDFSMLLDTLPNDAVAAFEKFLNRYNARPVLASEAKNSAPQLDFEIPATLPGGFRLEKAYTLRFGDETGAAARYSRDGEFLGVIFHRPVHREEFGTHKDYECAIGNHRGHAVAVGEWKLVHVTDASTCHCVLSKLDDRSELPEILKAVAPRSMPQSHSEEQSHGHGS